MPPWVMLPEMVKPPGLVTTITSLVASRSKLPVMVMALVPRSSKPLKPPKSLAMVRAPPSAIKIGRRAAEAIQTLPVPNAALLARRKVSRWVWVTVRIDSSVPPV